MQKYFNNVTNRTGDVVPGAIITVTVAATGALAPIYSDNGVTPKANPITADNNGYFEFYAADGNYTLTINGSGIRTQTMSDVQIEDLVTLSPDASTPTDGAAEELPVKQGGAFKRMTLQALGNWLVSVATFFSVGAVVRTILNKLRDSASPEDYGAVGNGVTDDMAAIIAACASGRRINGNGRTYAINGNMQLTGLTVLENLTLKQTAPATVNCRTVYAAGLSDFTIRDVKIDRNGGTAVGDTTNYAGIYLTNCSRFAVDGLECFGGGPGSPIAFTNCTDFTVVKPVSRDHTHNVGATDDIIQGIWFYGCQRFTCLAPRVRNLLSAVAVIPAGGATGTTTVVYTRGIAVGGCSDFSIVGGNISMVDQGIDTSGGPANNENFTYSGIAATDCGTWGFKFANSSRAYTVSNCVSVRAGHGGFVASGPSGAVTNLPRDGEFIGCVAINTGSSGVWPVAGNSGFRVLSSSAVDPSYPRAIRFNSCKAIDNQGSPTASTGFANDVAAASPNATGYNKSDLNTATDCEVVGIATPYSGMHWHYAVLNSSGGGTGSATDSTWTALNLNSEVDDPGALHSTSFNNNAIYVKSPGLYHVDFAAQFNGNATGIRKARITLNGVATGREWTWPANGTIAVTMAGSTPVMVNTPGSSIAMEIWQNSGAGLVYNRDVASLSAARIQ